MITYAKTALANNETRNALISLIDNAPKAGFIVVHELKTEGGHGEIATYTFQKGVRYASDDTTVETVKTRSLDQLAKIEANPMFSITVKRGTWQNAQGEINPTSRKSKDYPIPVVVETTYGHCDTIMASAIAKIKTSISFAKEATKEWTTLGNGIYQDEAGKLYLRDLQRVYKKVIQNGDYPFTASGEEVALANAIKKDLPIGKYRCFSLDEDYSSISIGGHVIEGGEVLQEKEAIAQAQEVVMAGE